MISPKEVFQRIRRLQISATRKVEDLFAGAYRSAFKGKGLEFEDVREYQVGDEIRRIDWNVTARMQHPFVKNFHEERELTVILIIDISASSTFGSGSRLKSEIIAEIGAILAFSALQNQDKVGLLLFTKEVELYLNPKKGLRHALRVIRELLFFEPKQRGTNIQQALAFLGQVRRKHAICFLISDFLANINEFAHEANLLSKRHELIFIEVQDPHEQTFPNLGLVRLGDLESQDIQLIDSSNPLVQSQFKEQSSDRHQTLTQLAQRIGAGLILIDCQQPYIHPLRKFFYLRGSKR